MSVVVTLTLDVALVVVAVAAATVSLVFGLQWGSCDCGRVLA